MVSPRTTTRDADEGWNILFHCKIVVRRKFGGKLGQSEKEDKVEEGGREGERPAAPHYMSTTPILPDFV